MTYYGSYRQSLRVSTLEDSAPFWDVNRYAFERDCRRRTIVKSPNNTGARGYIT
jgi:hypothetical protein